MAPFPRICRPSISDPYTCAPKYAVVCSRRRVIRVRVQRYTSTHVSHASSSDKGVVHEPSRCGLPYRTARSVGFIVSTGDGRTCVWLAINSDISASMLVFPKYSRFFTSKDLMSVRAVPSATCRWIIMTWCLMGEQERGVEYETYQPAEISLLEFTVHVSALVRLATILV